MHAHLHERAGGHGRAIAHYHAAAARTASVPERDYLTLRAARLVAATGAAGAGRATGTLPEPGARALS